MSRKKGKQVNKVLMRETTFCKTAFTEQLLENILSANIYYYISLAFTGIFGLSLFCFGEHKLPFRQEQVVFEISA